MVKTYSPTVRILQIIAWLFIMCALNSHAQDVKFNHVLGAKSTNGLLSLSGQQDFVLGIAQDKYGFIWLGRKFGGLQRYDGSELKKYHHDPSDANTLANDHVECLVIDKENTFWLGTYGSGLDQFDESTDTFSHLRHDPANNSTLSNDTVTALLTDRNGNIWVGTQGGLNLLDKKSGTFKRFVHDPTDPTSLSSNVVNVIYEDKSGTIWVGCGRIKLFPDNGDGGLNRLEPKTGSFTRYLHDNANPKSITNNRICALLEDSKGNFWVGTSNNGLDIMDKKTGTFEHYAYDPSNLKKLSAPVLYSEPLFRDHISFIAETPSGIILIGSYTNGVNSYDPSTQKTIHHGYIFESWEMVEDHSASGLTETNIFNAYTANDGVIWFGTLGGQLFNVQSRRNKIPYFIMSKERNDVNSIVAEDNNNILWLGTKNGLIKRNVETKTETNYKNDPAYPPALKEDVISSIKMDSQGNIWMGTNATGLCYFDTLNHSFKLWRHDENNTNSIADNKIWFTFIDRKQNIWLGTNSAGVDKFDPNTETFTHYPGTKGWSGSSSVSALTQDNRGIIWSATGDGVIAINPENDSVAQYVKGFNANTVMTDYKGIVWVGGASLLYFDSTTNKFKIYSDFNLREEMPSTINIIEDKQKNLWVTTANKLLKIDSSRGTIHTYDESYGVHLNEFNFSDNFVSNDGTIYLGDTEGYYSFKPDLVKEVIPPKVVLTSFRINELEVIPGQDQPIKTHIFDAKEITLNYNQNSFSFQFTAIKYTSPGDKQFLFKLEHYDDTWHHIGKDHKAFFSNVPPGNYIFHVRGVSPDGSFGERSIAVMITPPWWRTWWAYTLFGLAFILTVYAIIIYRSKSLKQANRFLEERVAKRTEELKQQKEKVESTLVELKSTQLQLIQSEKMASLGELTAGIAHEIKNPLNFVNNFSELNTELIAELKQEVDNQNYAEVRSLAEGISENEVKIAHHGKRAEAIVNSMLQHSRTGSGQKVPADLNALVDEFSRLSYHGLRAKDKHFNATINTELDDRVGLVPIVQQDIGRVLLNLFNNAFYAVHDKKVKMNGGKNDNNDNFEPTIFISTIRREHHVIVVIKDNGLGIPKQIEEKIFQPFFTTKPTGEGTGLGLSLSYEIVKAHGGEISVKSVPGEGAEFIIVLPA